MIAELKARWCATPCSLLFILLAGVAILLASCECDSYFPCAAANPKTKPITNVIPHMTSAKIPLVLPVRFLEQTSMIEVASIATPARRAVAGTNERTQSVHVAAMSPVGVFDSLSTGGCVSVGRLGTGRSGCVAVVRLILIAIGCGAIFLSISKQCLHLIASSWISSAQYGHFFIGCSSFYGFHELSVPDPLITPIVQNRHRNQPPSVILQNLHKTITL